MNVVEFIYQLKQLDIRLFVEEDRLRCNAPKGVLTQELRENISAHKEEIMAFLKDAGGNQSSNGDALESFKIEPVSGLEHYPLSYSQMRLWFLDQFDPGNTAYSIPLVIRFEGELNAEVLEKSLNEIIKRQASTRTTFTPGEDGQPVQVIHSYMWQELNLLDFSGRPEPEKEATSQEYIINQAQVPFDLLNGPLFRMHLIRLSPTHHWLMVNMHHIISDGWSSGILITELSEYYQSLMDGQPCTLPALPVQYRDYAIWQRKSQGADTLRPKLEFWKQKLSGRLPILDLPADHPRPKNQTYKGAVKRTVLPDDLATHLKQLSNQQGVTLYMTMLAVFNVLLYRYTGQEDLIVGTANANRVQPEVERLIGFFVNTLVLRNNLSGDPSFSEFLKRVRDVALESFANREVPFEAVVEVLHLERDTSHSPVFQVMFILQNTPFQSVSFPDLKASPVHFDGGSAKYDLSLIIWDSPEGLTCFYEFNTDIYEGERIERMMGHYETLLKSVCGEPELRIGELKILKETEREKILEGWNATRKEYPREKTIQRLLTEQCKQNPQRVAIQDEEGQITYGELERRANQLGRYLQRLGVGPEQLVGVSLPRTIEMVVALLGILKAGGAYLPLDPNFPAERLGYMLEDSRALVLLTERKVAGTYPTQDVKVVYLEEEREAIEGESGEDFDGGGKAENLAYVIYTSGSTGKPKGVEVLQRGVVNFLSSMKDEPGLSAEDVLLSVTTLSFDIAGLELYLPLMVGARILLVSSATAADGEQLKKALEESGATVMQATPATWRLLIGAGWKGRSDFKVLCGGEALPADLVKGLLERSSELWNLYGPTETTIWSTVSKIDREKEDVTIGKPIGNTRVYILDGRGEPVPVGVSGELYIGGEGVARGYLRREELTKEKFVEDRFAKGGGRMYRTGDLARYLPDGRIDFLGRIDNQVKLRGFRIELGEIETVLSQHPDVRQVVVVAREDNPGDKRLVAYLLSRKAPAPTASELRAFLHGKLPEYMIPSIFMFLEKFPLTPNSKVDRRSLPVPETTRPDLATNFVSPRNESERILAEIWQQALKVEKVGINDNFFELGGHSLLIVQIHHQICQKFQAEITIAQMFQYPTIQTLAQFLDQPQNETANQVNENIRERAMMQKQAMQRQGNRSSKLEGKQS